jgi:hypothetical protein
MRTLSVVAPEPLLEFEFEFELALLKLEPELLALVSPLPLSLRLPTFPTSHALRSSAHSVKMQGETKEETLMAFILFSLGKSRAVRNGACKLPVA